MNTDFINNNVPENDDYNSLWEIADLAFEELKVEEKSKKEKSKKEIMDNKYKEKEIICKHKQICEGVCMQCGSCLFNTSISADSEWNNYKDDSGNFTKNTQRCDIYTDTNPYSKGGTLLTNNKNSFMAKLQIQLDQDEFQQMVL